MLQLSLLQIPVADARVAGFCVVADSEPEALRTIIEISKRHFALPGGKAPVQISISDYPLESCRVSIEFDARAGSIDFENVDKNLTVTFMKHFRNFGQFFILAGYSNAKTELIPPSQFYIVSHNVYHDQKRLQGKQRQINVRALLFELF